MITHIPFYVPVIAAFFLALLLTPAVRASAARIGAVSSPTTDRWHRKPTATLGGVAIALSVMAVNLSFLPYSRNGLAVLGASAFLFLVGLLDDFLHLKPYQKLIGQIIGAAIVVYFGLTLPWTGSIAINSAITILWLVGITNAVNLLDNMDGLAAGIATIASIFLGLNFLHNDQPAEALMLAIFAAALVGFLIFNSHPASIFMGDGGSMFIGFFLASTALLTAAGTSGRSRSLIPVLAVPVLILFIPIFDTTLVTLVRKISGRAASKGGRDHASHRLVALGMSERSAVWMLYGFATLSGLVALVVRDRELDVSLAAIATFTVVLALIGVYLAGVKVYDESELSQARERPLVAFLVDLSYKRRVFEVLLDLILIVLAYYLAHALLFGPIGDTAGWRPFMRTLPLVAALKLAVFLAVGVYRGLWRYVGIDSVMVYLRAVVISSIATVMMVLFAFRFEGFLRSVFVLDAVLLLMFVTGSRGAFRVFGKLLPMVSSSPGRRVLIFGAGDAGELLLRELRNNRTLQFEAVGFLDDDPRKIGKVLHGLTVYHGTNLRRVCERMRVDEVIISSAKFGSARLRSMLEEAGETVRVKRMRIQLEPMDSRSIVDFDDTANRAILYNPEAGDAPRDTRDIGSIHLVDKLDSPR